MGCPSLLVVTEVQTSGASTNSRCDTDVSKSCKKISLLQIIVFCIVVIVSCSRVKCMSKEGLNRSMKFGHHSIKRSQGAL